MSLNGFTGWLFSALLSWMQIIYNGLWSMLASGGQDEFMPWFSDNWARIALILIVAGLVIDYTVYLMRWQPHHIWLNALRRAQSAVTRPFKKEQRAQHYAGYRRVLEGADDAPSAARAPEQPKRPMRTYEAVPARAQSASSTQSTRRVQAQNAHRAQSARSAQPVRTAQAPRAPQAGRGRMIMPDEQHVWPARESAPAARNAQRDTQTYEARPVAVRRVTERPAETVRNASQKQKAQNTRPPQTAQPIQREKQSTALDAEGYVPETVQSVDEPLFSAPPEFARSHSSAAPVYGRVYQGAHQPILPIGMDPESSRHQMQMPELPPEARDELQKAAQDDRPRSVQAETDAPGQSVSAPRPSIAVKPVEREQPRPRRISVREAEGRKYMGFDE